MDRYCPTHGPDPMLYDEIMGLWWCPYCLAYYNARLKKVEVKE